MWLTRHFVETGALFELLTRLMELEAGSTIATDLSPVVKLLGQYFQIRDDYLNLKSSEVSLVQGPYPLIPRFYLTTSHSDLWTENSTNSGHFS